MRTPSNRPQVRYPSNYKANFLWPFASGTVEEAGYEFANARTESYRKSWWKILIARMKKEQPLIRHGDISRFKAILNEMDAKTQSAAKARGESPVLHQNGPYHQLKRLYGDYLYHQDRDKFNVDMIDWIEAGRPNKL